MDSCQVKERLQALKHILERRGRVTRKRDSLPDRYCVRYEEYRAGGMVEASIQLGKDRSVAEGAAELIHGWQEAYRRRCGGLPCDTSTQDQLMRVVPIVAGYSARTRCAYRRGLRNCAGDPLRLLSMIASFDQAERNWPGGAWRQEYGL